VGYHEVFLSRKVFVMLWLFLFNGGEFLEAFWGSSGLAGVLGGSGQNRPDWFAKPI
jgi:hypothetical protein